MKLTDQSLLELMSINDTEIELRKALLGFGKDDIQAIKSCKSFINDEIEEITDNFYAKLTSFDEMVIIVGDSDTLARLRLTLRKYILELFGGFYDLEYVNSRLRIGLVHKRIGVEPKYYLSAVNFLKDILCSTIKKNLSGKKAETAVCATEKLLSFDTELVVDTYIRSLINEVDMERKKAVEHAASLEEKVAERTEELKEMTQRDELTGLYNFRALHDMLRREILRANRMETGLTLVYFDIDKFKGINDTLGHKKGDEILMSIADSIRKTVREDDFACRYGGDEFCIILSNSDTAKAEKTCKRLFADFSKKQKKVTLSVGIAQADLKKLDVPDTLIKEADMLMYKSKKKAGFSITVGEKSK